MSKKGKSGSKGSKGIPSGAGPQIWARGGSGMSSRGKGADAVGGLTGNAKQPCGKNIIAGGKKGK